MRLDITRDGSTAVVELDLVLTNLSMQEQRRVEEVIGEERFAAWGRGEGHPSPLLLLALVYGKLLHTPFKDLTIDDIDFDISELAALADTDEEKEWVSPSVGPGSSGLADAVVIPMETTTGTVEAEVDIGRQ